MRKTIIAIASCIVLLLLGYAGFRGYKVWKQNHWLTMAKDFAAKADARNEILCLQQLLRINPRNLEACRMMADLTEAARSPSALIWRQRTLELNPNSVEDRLALAQTAMLFKDYATATNALAKVKEADQKNANYQNLAGVVDISLGQLADAAGHFSEAARLEPANPTPRLNLAILRLHGSNTLDLAEARIDLKRISMEATNFTMRCQATRELIGDALRFKDTATALTLSQALVQPTNAFFSDKLLRLDVLKTTGSAELKPAIAQYERDAGSNGAAISEMATWLMTRTSPAETLTWMHTLPMATQTNQPAATLIAGCQVLTQDWTGLQNSLSKQNWDELDFARHAFLARSLRGQKLEGAATAEWAAAMQLTRDGKAGLTALFRLAAQWQWDDEAEQILWKIINQYPEESWAGQTLQQALIMGGRTRSLMQLFSVQAKRMPADMEIKNNLAMTAMLLNSQEVNPYGLAREAYDKMPQNPSYASTYAFSLYQQKQYAEALKVMQKLTPKQLNDPSIAGYYGLILKATGDNAKAQSYLGWALKGKLLPEEQKLFQQAQSH